MNYAIFRNEPIYNLNDLAQIRSHNKREKKSYQSNPDIVLEKTKENFDLVPLDMKYTKGFYEITKEYQKEHDMRMETEREDRKRSFRQMVDKSKNVVADEMIFTTSPGYSDNKSKEEIRKWADTCMEFVYNDLGYTKEQILHSTVHMDEKTPHIHCIVVPLIKKYDKRTSTERYTISKKQYIRDKDHLSQLQDKYCDRLNSAGFDLERGIKNSDVEHIAIKDFKKLTRNLEKQLSKRNDSLELTVSELEENMKSNKSVMFDKESVKIKKETFESMNKVIDKAKKLNDLKPKMKKAIEDIEYYTDNYRKTFKENNKLNNEIYIVETRNEGLSSKVSALENTLKVIRNIIERIADFFYHLVADGLVPKDREQKLRELLGPYYKEYKEKTKNKSKDNSLSL